MLTILTFLIILSILIFVHEFGHFIVAKRTGIKVEEFGFGLPPRIWGKKIGETFYSLNALPFGGFVKLYGENEPVAGEKTGKSRQFLFKPKRIRAAVTVAGVLMNFLLAVLLFSAIYTKLGIPTPGKQIRILGVVPSSPAHMAGLKEDDAVVSAGGEMIKNPQEFVEVTKKYLGREMTLEIIREKDNPCQVPERKEQVLNTYLGLKIACRGENMLITTTPRVTSPEGEGPLGVLISNIEIKFYPFWEMPIRGAAEGVRESWGWTVLIAGSLGQMLYQWMTAGVVPKDVAGPLGIFQLTGQVTQIGGLAVLRFLGILSINLAIINILPLPALDGGRLLFIGIESIIGRRVSTKVEAYIHQIGLILILLLAILITYNDIRRIVGSLSLLEYLRQVLPFKF